MKLFLAPHNDDEALFGAYIIQKFHIEQVLVIYDGLRHQQMFGVPIQQRRDESKAACALLNTEVSFLGIPDTVSYDEQIKIALASFLKENEVELLFAPDHRGGSLQHDLVSESAYQSGIPTMYYGTYSKTDYVPRGDLPIKPTKDEEWVKAAALQCYKSQHDINKPHFDAVIGVPEYLSLDIYE